MPSRHYTSYRIEDRSYLSIVKREINRKLKENGFSEQKVGEIDIIVSEMTSNLVKHANAGGSLLYRVNTNDAGCCFEVLCLDEGPGMNDTGKMMQDGMSSSNTLGQGLGAIRRLSDEFSIYSRLNWGTILYAKKNLHEPALRLRQRPLQVEVVQEAIPGEKVCGDGFFVKELPDATHVFVADGLGHGEHAYEAVKQAIEAFHACEEKDPCDVLRYIHERVKKTRGLVGSVAILDHRERKWRHAGIGNIATRITRASSTAIICPTMASSVSTSPQSSLPI
jgi:anti-sigma regulatory factor (Ser/Thr protein kinase)